VVDANSSATDLLGLSVAEMTLLPVVGLFSIEKRDSLKSILRLGNFDTFETLAVGFKDECIPVKILNSGLAKDNSGLQTLVMRDLREIEKLRLAVAAASRRSQQAFCRNRELAALARKQSRQIIEEKLKTLTQTVHRWLPCTVGCFVVLWDNGAEQFSVVASSASNPLKTDALMAEDAPLLSQLTDNGEPLVVSKVAEDNYRIRSLYSSEPVNAFCAFPLMTEDGMMGFFLVCDRNHREFASEELDYLTIVAQLITNACDHAMLEERLYLMDPYENTH
jgi:GAF domain-containing protein